MMSSIMFPLSMQAMTLEASPTTEEPPLHYSWIIGLSHIGITAIQEVPNLFDDCQQSWHQTKQLEHGNLYH